ncbi:hypothetical protein [uncultured Methanobrevibacter sp.]|uniref:hypothetical protein n=1 Tax=uncultured Methanobrevibacter sp. TaxID=253161 RepID=UPI0025E93E07|nr:hypothetical protein [uncultured Methanobrevibacter sp.]
MIDLERYNNLKEKYGHVSSWTIWREPGESAKSNTDDMSIFEDDNICNKLNDKYVFVALNWSGTHGVQEDKPWKNFHSSYRYQNDFKLRFALINTPFWGSYITDIIKEFPELNSKNVISHFKENPNEIYEYINSFKEELSCLSDEKPILIAVGNDSYNILNDNLGNEYEIHRIMHYSARISKEDYKKEVCNELKKIKS